jgi:hypothetical protein
MIGRTQLHEFLATVDVRELETLRWGPIRLMFPRFVEEIELGRYLRRLLAHEENRAVAIEPHRESDGRDSTHVFDVYRVEKLAPPLGVHLG